jgi:hypothetical protein
MNGRVMSVAGFGPLEVALVALVALVGALVIHNWPGRHRKRMEALAQSASPQVANPARASDGELDAVRSAMLAAAQQMGLPERLLPGFGSPSGGDGDFVYRDGAEYVYCAFERGARLSELRTADIDDLLYRVFRDRAWTRTYTSLIGQDLSEQDHAARLAEGQLALLQRGDPRWAQRLRTEQE